MVGEQSQNLSKEVCLYTCGTVILIFYFERNAVSDLPLLKMHRIYLVNKNNQSMILIANIISGKD
jgi:hypothetical protein